MDQRGHDCGALRPRKIPARILYRTQRLCIGVWRSGIVDHRAGVGFLFGADFLLRRGVHPGLRTAPWEPSAILRTTARGVACELTDPAARPYRGCNASEIADAG